MDVLHFYITAKKFSRDALIFGEDRHIINALVGLRLFGLPSDTPRSVHNKADGRTDALVGCGAYGILPGRKDHTLFDLFENKNLPANK
ncbi:MAG: hypothetical protein LBH86_00190 [Oscillospiraceae bacterium]|nr:hypothetical protein [Oscillospiraceae bacterium]